MPPTTSTFFCGTPAQTAATTAVMTASLLAIGAVTWVLDILQYRRRFSSRPIKHRSLLFRDPRLPLAHPANRIFNVRPDRNILASGLLAHCHFEPELLLDKCRPIRRVEGSRMKELLAFMMDTKRDVDDTRYIASPLPYGTVGTPAAAIEGEWVTRVSKALRGPEWEMSEWGRDDEGYDDEEPAFEVWEVVVKNWCAGWVVEPFHANIGSLDDDDEMPFTWTNAKGTASRGGFKASWPGRGGNTFAT